MSEHTFDTVQDLADLLGVTRASVYSRADRLGIEVQNITERTFSDEDIAALKEKPKKTSIRDKQINKHIEDVDNTKLNGYLLKENERLNAEVERLNALIEEKDLQIKEANEHTQNVSNKLIQLTDQQQQLSNAQQELTAIQTKAAEHTNEVMEKISEEVPAKKKIFGIF